MIDFLKQIWNGSTIYRILMEREIKDFSRNFSGQALDLASGSSPRYWRWLPDNLKIQGGDIKGSNERIDFNGVLPFADETFDVVFLVNALYIVRNREELNVEILRILKLGGKFLLVSPFIANEMPDPDDFIRLTKQGLENELSFAGFRVCEMRRFGERFTSAAYLLDPVWRFRLVRVVIYALALVLDRLIPSNVKQRHPTPLGYICIGEKQYAK
jgi:SAM-dependent methyltransferase